MPVAATYQLITLGKKCCGRVRPLQARAGMRPNDRLIDDFKKGRCCSAYIAALAGLIAASACDRTPSTSVTASAIKNAYGHLLEVRSLDRKNGISLSRGNDQPDRYMVEFTAEIVAREPVMFYLLDPAATGGQGSPVYGVAAQNGLPQSDGAKLFSAMASGLLLRWPLPEHQSAPVSGGVWFSKSEKGWLPDSIQLYVATSALGNVLAARREELNRLALKEQVERVMKSDLRNLATRQETYFGDHQTYAVASDLGIIAYGSAVWQPSAGVSVVASGTFANVNGWGAQLSQAGSTRTCSMFVGSGATARFVDSAQPEGEPACYDDENTQRAALYASEKPRCETAPRACDDLMRSELRLLEVAQQEYFSDYHKYATASDTGLFGKKGRYLWKPRKEVRVVPDGTSGSKSGWNAQLSYIGSTRTCALYVGAGGSGAFAGSGQREGESTCY